MTQHVRWNEIPEEQLSPKLARRYVNGAGVTVARFVLRKGLVVPEHSHANEQVTCILEGALKFTLEGREIVVRAGETLVIPPNLPPRRRSPGRHAQPRCLHPAARRLGNQGRPISSGLGSAWDSMTAVRTQRWTSLVSGPARQRRAGFV